MILRWVSKTTIVPNLALVGESIFVYIHFIKNMNKKYKYLQAILYMQISQRCSDACRKIYIVCLRIIWISFFLILGFGIILPSVIENLKAILDQYPDDGQILKVWLMTF